VVDVSTRPACRTNCCKPLADGEIVVAASAKNMLAVLPRVLAVVREGDDKVAALLGRLGCEVRVCAMLTWAWPNPSPLQSNIPRAPKAG
jgi:hypothetical protein